jgi:ABC-type lipoprotein release transport system permease subunit
LEESKQIPEEKNSIESSSEIKKEINKEENVKAFTEFLENASNQNIKEEKANSDVKEKKPEFKDNSLFKRILNDGFDGISSNPNYKMLALLIILLINLSLFFVIGNIGKAFLRNAGIM